MIQKSKKFKSSHLPKFQRNLAGAYQTIFFSTLIGMISLFIIGFLIFSNFKISQKRAELTARIETLKKEIQILEEKNQQLRAGISQSSAESYLEKEARERLGLKKPGEEVVVVLPPEDYNPPTAHPESSWQKLENFWQKFLEKLGF